MEKGENEKGKKGREKDVTGEKRKGIKKKVKGLRSKRR